MNDFRKKGFVLWVVLVFISVVSAWVMFDFHLGNIQFYLFKGQVRHQEKIEKAQLALRVLERRIRIGAKCCEVGAHGFSWFLQQGNDWWNSHRDCQIKIKDARFSYVTFPLKKAPCVYLNSQPVEYTVVILKSFFKSPIYINEIVALPLQKQIACQKTPQYLSSFVQNKFLYFDETP